jgi:hypothetical protein
VRHEIAGRSGGQKIFFFDAERVVECLHNVPS